MPVEQLIPIPFLLDFSNIQVDTSIIYAISILIAVTINAEGQAMMATTLGDIQKDSKLRFHFNPLFHLDIPGLLCFAVAGFGWPRYVPIETKKFKYPNTYLILSRFAGPLANLLLAGIAGSIIWIYRTIGVQDQVFTIVLSVNLMVFVFSFLPLPPLAGASFFCPLLPKKRHPAFTLSVKISPYMLLILFIILKYNRIEMLNNALYPIVRAFHTFIIS